MRVSTAMVTLLVLICFAAPSFAQGEPKPASISGSMSTKFTRGVSNIVFSWVEIPKQWILSTRDEGATGFFIGPLKGVGMTAYRVVVGTIETAFFMVPQPGYYDPMTDPDYVWNGWEKEQPPSNYVKAKETEKPEPAEMNKGE